MCSCQPAGRSSSSCLQWQHLFFHFFVSSFYYILLIQHVFVLWAKRLHCSSSTENGRKILKDGLAAAVRYETSKQTNQKKKKGQDKKLPDLRLLRPCRHSTPAAATRPLTPSFLLKSHLAA